MIFRFIKRLFLTVVVVIVAFAAFVYFSLQANVPDSRLALQPPNGAASDQAPILIFGATRNTGLEFAKLLSDRGEQVVAFVRSSSDRTELEKLNAEFLVGDAMDLDSVRDAMNSQPFRAAVTTVGCFRCDPPIDFVANRNIIDAAKESGVEQLLLVTTIGSGDSIDSVPMLSKMMLKDIFPLKTQAEEHLKNSGIRYTVIRPGGLGFDTATGGGILSEDPAAFGFINRSDLAQLMLSCLDHDTCSNKTLAALDTNKPTPW